MKLPAAVAAPLLLVASAMSSHAQQPFRPSGAPAADNLTVETVASGLANPWAIAFLPDGRMLVTERAGRLRIVAKGGNLSPPVDGRAAGVRERPGRPARRDPRPRLRQERHDLFLLRDAGERRRPDRARPRAAGRRQSAAARWRQGDLPAGGTAVERQPLRLPHRAGARRKPVSHDRRSFPPSRRGAEPRQSSRQGDPRHARTARVPPDNPFVKRAGAKPEIWSYGHRNMQGAALHPQSGKLWTHEHGARGGDEVNIPEAGKNYGWPVITWGIDYSGAKIGVGTQQAGMEQPVKYWVPSIAPSGMAFYTGDLFPAWRGNLFVGALAGADAGAARDQRREGRRRGATVAKSARAHPRRAARPRRCALSRDRQFQRPHFACVAGEVRPRVPGAAQHEMMRCRPGTPVSSNTNQPGSRISGAPLRAAPRPGHELNQRK